jgi:hypothetical protein
MVLGRSSAGMVPVCKLMPGQHGRFAVRDGHFAVAKIGAQGRQNRLKGGAPLEIRMDISGHLER